MENTDYKGYKIEEDLTGYAPKNNQFSFYLDDGELYVGSGESIEDCKIKIDEIIDLQDDYFADK